MEYIKLPNDPQGLHYGLFVDQRLVSIVSAFIVKGEAQFRKFATLPEEQGKGYGSQLLTYLFKELRAKQVHKVWCNARRHKASFYERWGLSQTDNFFSRGGINYVIMELRLS